LWSRGEQAEAAWDLAFFIGRKLFEAEVLAVLVLALVVAERLVGRDINKIK